MLFRSNADEPAARADADTPAPEQHADSARDPQTPGDITQEHSDRAGYPYQGFSVAEAERTVGDTTPTGIGLKPTGEQLLGMEGDDPSRNRLDRFFDKAFEDDDDVSDAMGHIGEAIDADLHSGPGPSGVPQSYHATTAAIHDQPPPAGPSVSDVVGSIAVTGVAAVVAIRHFLSERRKEHQP